jgi:hypothetical protein
VIECPSQRGEDLARQLVGFSLAIAGAKATEATASPFFLGQPALREATE